MSFIKATFVAVALFSLAACGNLQPLRNIENTPVVYNLKLDQVKSAIMQAGIERGWVMKQIKSGEIQGELFVREHRAVIDITYSPKSYSINYVNSKNLKYTNGKIHRNYNRWINNLDKDIQIALAKLSAQ